MQQVTTVNVYFVNFHCTIFKTKISQVCMPILIALLQIKFRTVVANRFPEIRRSCEKSQGVETITSQSTVHTVPTLWFEPCCCFLCVVFCVKL